MNLVQAEVSHSELATVEKFLPIEARRKLDKFTGTVVNMTHVFQKAPTQKHQAGVFSSDVVPMLALGRMHADSVTLDITAGDYIFHPQVNPIVVPSGKGPQHRTVAMYRTKMPPVPAALMSQYRHEKNAAVLFEVSAWERVGRMPLPALEDPAIVEHLAGTLWLVRAHWDLTPLEKKVLAQIQL